MLVNSNTGSSPPKLSGDSCCTIDDNRLRLLGEDNSELGVPRLVDFVEDEGPSLTISLIFVFPDRGLHLSPNSTSCEIAFLFPALEDTARVITMIEIFFFDGKKQAVKYKVQRLFGNIFDYIII
jgi:hypothetical protein